MKEHPQQTKKTSVIGLLADYKGQIGILVILTLLGNLLGLAIPKIISHAIDSFVLGGFLYGATVVQFLLVATGIFLFTVFQNVAQTLTSEKVARDLREKISQKISKSSFLFVQNSNPSKLLTYLTSDVDSIKMFVAQAVSSLISSVVIIIGASIMLLIINVKLGLAVISIIPIIALTFFFVLKKVRVLFVKSRELIDWLNKVINESILGAALIRVVSSERSEYEKFNAANSDAKQLGLKILGLFAAMIPAVTFVANLGTLIILLLGGKFVIDGTMSIGNFAAFNSYTAILVFPIFIIGFMMNIISQAGASYGRISTILLAEVTLETGTIKSEIVGNITVSNVTVVYGEKTVLDKISFGITAGTRNAIIGPTAAGKSQLLYLLTGLISTESGSIEYDGLDLSEYDSETLHRQIGFVFQDSIMFNLSIRENIAFSDTATDSLLQKAIKTAELTDFIKSLPDGLSTIVSERGSSLSGGQKQRIMLARALALNPKVLLLDDFTARVDANTEKKILHNIAKNYPDITLVSVTQKIVSIEAYENIIVLMEGELLATGTHKELLASSPEYVQIFNSQKSTNTYELQT
jgi:ATP-binding cassette subfamily B protein